MKFGVCGPIEKAAFLAEAGFDYIEGFTTAVTFMSEDDFQKLAKDMDSLPIKAEAFCVMFTSKFKLIGGECNLDEVREYLNLAFSRTKRLGAEVSVFGSGAIRMIPDGYEKDRAWSEMVTLCTIIGEKAKEHGITALIEPLRVSETNNITTQEEGLKLVKDVNHPNFKVLCDFYHLVQMGGTSEDIRKCGSDLLHTHLANPQTRACPFQGDGAEYSDYFNGVKSANYKGRVSLECNWTDLELEAPGGLLLLKELAKEYQL